MSLVKNNNDPFDTSVTIKRLLKNTALTLGTNSYYFRWYHEVNNKYARLNWNIQPGESVFIKCEIDANAEGYLYGYVSGANIYVYKNGTTHQIQWRNGTTVVYSVDCDDKVHVIGWMGYVPNSQSLANRGCMPFYDGTTDTTHVIDASGYNGYARICGAVNSGTDAKNCIHSTGTWAIRLYEVQANATHTYGETILRDFHCYAAVYNTSATNGVIVNTLFDWGSSAFYNGSAVSGVTMSDSVVNFEDNVDGYGVQLDDLRHIARTGYYDIIAALTDDGGKDEDAGWDTEGSGIGQAEVACTLTQDTDVRNFAFGLSGLPIPSGWTIANAGIQGELKLGRRPKWSIWDDGVKFGKYATTDSPSKMKFNIYRKNDGTLMSDFDLGWLEGYDTDTTKIHPPHFNLGDASGNIVLETHNGMACTIKTTDTIIGGRYDEQTVSKFSLAAGALGTVCLGNLPMFNYTKDEQEVNEGMQRLVSFGGGILFKPYGGSSIVMSLMEFTDQTYMDGQTERPYPLSSGSRSDIKDKFQINGFSGEGFFTGNFTDYMKNYLHTQGVSYLDIVASMCLAKSIGADGSNPSLIIDCSNFAPEKKARVSISDNPHVYDTRSYGTIVYGDRLVVGDNGGVEKVNGTEYDVNIFWGSNRYNYEYQAVILSKTAAQRYDGRALFGGFCLAKVEGQTINYVSLYNNGTPLFVSYAEVNVAQAYSSASNTPIVSKYRGFTKLVPNNTQTNKYYLPFALEGSNYTAQKIYPANNSGVSRDYLGAAFFMWYDLMHPGKTRTIPTINQDPASDRPTDPFTAHLRIFKISEAPHAWYVYAPNGFESGTDNGKWHWSTSTENPFKAVSNKFFEFHLNGDGLIANGNTDGVDTYISMYSGSNKIVNTTSDQTVIKSNLTNRTITVYSQPAYEAIDDRTSTTEFSETISSTYWQSNTEYRHALTNWILHLEVCDIPFYTRDMYGDGGGIGTSNYIRIRAEYTGSDASVMNAKMYFIDIT